jgi:hypothetical protein
MCDVFLLEPSPLPKNNLSDPAMMMMEDGFLTSDKPAHASSSHHRSIRYSCCLFRKSTMIRRATLLVLVALYACVASAFVTPRPISAAVSIHTGSYNQFTPQSPFSQERQHGWSLQMSTEQEEEKKSNLPFWLDPGTKGGAVFLSLILFIVPIIGYSIVTNMFGYDPTEAGIYIGVGFTVLSTFLWVGTYIFRVATKDMTYVS